MGGLFRKKRGLAASEKRHKKTTLNLKEHQLKEKMKAEKDALNVLDLMLRERDEILKMHEEKVVVLRQQYEKKLAELKVKEERLRLREQEMEKLERLNRDLLMLKKQLERECDELEKERALSEKQVAKEQTLLENLHKEEAHFKVEVSTSKKSLENMHRQFESAYLRATKLTDVLRVKEHELRLVDEKLRHAHKKHHEVSSQITHHSLKEVEACLRRADDFIEHGMIVKAKQEYEKIRKFYANLTSKEKKKIYNKIAKIKERLNYNF